MKGSANQAVRTGQCRVHISQDVVFRTVEGEHVLLDLRTGNFYSLNATGSEMWDLLREGLAVDEVARRFALHYDVAVEIARVDIGELVGELEKRGLVQLEKED